MRGSKSDHQHRKDLVLGLVVNEYIKTINPISSAHIVQECYLDLSSATVRSILAELERDGYLTHPHTSAGRVPTQEGYRYYVDHLMDEIQLLEEEKGRIRADYEQGVRDLETLLEKASRMLSELTQCTSIISVDGRLDRIFCKGTGYVVGYTDSRDIVMIGEILKTLEQKERVLEILNRRLEQNINIFIGHELACAHMEQCSLVLSRYQTEEGVSGRLAVLGPTRMNYPRVVGALEYFSDVMGRMP